MHCLLLTALAGPEVQMPITLLCQGLCGMGDPIGNVWSIGLLLKAHCSFLSRISPEMVTFWADFCKSIFLHPQLNKNFQNLPCF